MAKCQLINGSVSARSMWAENMAVNNKPVRCDEHSLFHSWEPFDGDFKRDINEKGRAARFGGYVEVSPGKWTLWDQKPSKKKSDN